MVLAMSMMVLTAGCRDSFAGLGSGARARTASDQLYGAFADRFLTPVHNAKYDYARRAHTRGALAPGSVFADTSAWTASSGAVRLLETHGYAGEGRYVVSSRPNVPAPSRPGDGRHVTTLSRLSNSEYRWDTAVDFAIGSARPADVALVMSRFFASAEGRTEREARADLAAAAPRTSAALGSVLTLDSLHPVTLPDGSTSVRLGISVHGDNLAKRLPALGDYVKRYVEPARYRFSFTDRSGVPYLEIVARDRFMSVQARVHHGKLVALSGPAHPMPDTLVLTADLALKVKLFTVGFHELQTEFVNGGRGDRERNWTITARREPKWDLPFIAARLMRAPLRRPFAGEGALFRIGVRAGEGDLPSVLVRLARLTVEESAVLRFINSLSNTALDDLEGRVEHEKSQWLRELFLALREDSRAAIP